MKQIVMISSSWQIFQPTLLRAVIMNAYQMQRSRPANAEQLVQQVRLCL